MPSRPGAEVSEQPPAFHCVVTITIFTFPYCWKQANLAVRPHRSIVRSDHKVDVLSVPPSAPRNLPVEFVHPAHVRKDWPVVPLALVAAQKFCTPSDFPSGVILIDCKIDPSDRSAKSSAILVPSGSTYGSEDLAKRVSGLLVPSDRAIVRVLKPGP